MPDKLIFPVGTFSGVWTHVELRKALELGYKITSFNEAVIYRKTFCLFGDYVNDLYDKRMIAKDAKDKKELVYKLFLNGLYGKLAQRPADFEIRHVSKPMDADRIIDFYGDEYVKLTAAERAPANFINPIISAYVTSQARIILYGWMMAAGDVVYCDTDSIFASTELPTSKKLGHLKLEKFLDRVCVVKPKHYMIMNENAPYEVKVKGFSRINSENFELLTRGGMVLMTKLVKYKEARKRNMNPGAVLDDYKKGASMEDTKRVWPQKFEEYEIQESKPLKLHIINNENVIDNRETPGAITDNLVNSK